MSPILSWNRLPLTGTGTLGVDGSITEGPALPLKSSSEQLKNLFALLPLQELKRALALKENNL